ncbi:hypothetical protein IFM89_031671 [Coptis chinensis]|uniref:Protein kinase domain-containing protein n=1 Tax=Coptis chinensis TaxID=261450 RepID=A0A835M7T4_9MAGN|nr:hypothetical protein IFM89_031671 [Coptis chinensis]
MRLLFPFRSTFDGRVRGRSRVSLTKKTGNLLGFASSYEEISNATNHFHQDNIVGRGGYQWYLRGDLCDGRTIAVKRLAKDNTDENKQKEFLMELGVLGHVCNPNTTCLIGCCFENGLHLIFEFSPNGNLSSALYDFGLAKWLPKQWTHHYVIPIEGTFGYLAPEYFMHGIVDEKTDVFAFGVLLLEIITGRRPIDMSKQSLMFWEKPLIESVNIEALADSKLEKSSEKHQVDLKSSEKMLTQLEDVGQQLAMTFSTDGSAFAVGGEKHTKVEDISLKGIRVWQRKRMGKIQACSQKYGVPNYGICFGLPTNNIFDKQKPMENDEQDSELSSLRKGLSLISIFHHIHANAVNITLNSIDVFNFLPTRTILKKWIRYYIDDKGLQTCRQATSRSASPWMREQQGLLAGVPITTTTNPPSKLAQTPSFRVSLGQPVGGEGVGLVALELALVLVELEALALALPLVLLELEALALALVLLDLEAWALVLLELTLVLWSWRHWHLH